MVKIRLEWQHPDFGYWVATNMRTMRPVIVTSHKSLRPLPSEVAQELSVIADGDAVPL